MNNEVRPKVPCGLLRCSGPDDGTACSKELLKECLAVLAEIQQDQETGEIFPNASSVGSAAVNLVGYAINFQRPTS